MAVKTMADYMRDEDELLRRKFVHATRPKRPLSMDEARELCERMDGKSSTADKEQR